jgi:hypothetical protein
MSDLQNSALMLGKVTLGVRVPITTQDEVGQAFNQMSDKLQDLQRLRHQMIPPPGGTDLGG